MTTPAAAAFYLSGHLSAWAGKGYEVYNPHNKPLEELPVIYGFNNGGAPEWLQAVAIAEDGNVLGSHICSHEGYMPHDLGITKDSRPDRHEEHYKVHYPDGYRMDFVQHGDEGLAQALIRNQLLADEQENTDETA
jgi:hypothetical protein